MFGQAASGSDMEKWNKMTALMMQIKQPHGLDSFVNKRDSKPNKNKESIAENVRILLQSDACFEDEAMGASAGGITSEDFAILDQETIQKMILGVDLDEAEEEDDVLQNMSENQQDNLKQFLE